MDSPGIEHALRHIAVLLQSENANRIAKLLAGEMVFCLLLFLAAGGARFLARTGIALSGGSHAQFLVGVVKRVKHKSVGLVFVAAVLPCQLDDLADGLGHEITMCVST